MHHLTRAGPLAELLEYPGTQHHDRVGADEGRYVAHRVLVVVHVNGADAEQPRGYWRME